MNVYIQAFLYTIRKYLERETRRSFSTNFHRVKEETDSTIEKIKEKVQREKKLQEEVERILVRLPTLLRVEVQKEISHLNILLSLIIEPLPAVELYLYNVMYSLPSHQDTMDYVLSLPGVIVGKNLSPVSQGENRDELVPLLMVEKILLREKKNLEDVIQEAIGNFIPLEGKNQFDDWKKEVKKTVGKLQKEREIIHSQVVIQLVNLIQVLSDLKLPNMEIIHIFLSHVRKFGLNVEIELGSPDTSEDEFMAKAFLYIEMEDLEGLQQVVKDLGYTVSEDFDEMESLVLSHFQHYP